MNNKRAKNRKIRLAQVFDMDNLRQADHEARRGKLRNKGVRIFDRCPYENLERLQQQLMTMTYHTSEGHECERMCPCGKVRTLHKLPYYPDHIVHHALMQVIMPVLTKFYYYDSSASIKGKGMHFAARRTARWIDENKDAGRLYYVKLDFVKFYHKIVQHIIYGQLCKTFTDQGIRYLLREVVTACNEGLGIGLYPIQSLANYYTSPLCRKVMAECNVRVEIYCDDMVIMSRDKREVWRAVNLIRDYASSVMQQPLHENIGMQIIDEHHRLDFVGYQFFFNHTLMRKKMKAKFKRAMVRTKDEMYRYQVATSYKGWLIHCNGMNLWRKVMNMKSFKELEVPKFEKRDGDGKRMLEGTRVSASLFVDREVVFADAEIDVKSKFNGKMSSVVQVEDNGIKYKFFTNNQRLIETLKFCKEKNLFPFKGTLKRANNSGLPDYVIT